MRRRPDSSDVRYNADEAARVVEFFETWLIHGDGLWSGQPFILEDWQRGEIIEPLYGWQRWSEQYEIWVRLYTKAWIELPRGNGKTPIGAGIVLEGLVADGESGAECYGAAEDRDQASIVFRDVAGFVKRNEAFEDIGVRVIDSRKRIVHEESNSFYQALPRDEMGEGAQGFRVHVALVDEVHVQKTKALMQALRKGMGKRTQSLMAMITTAGADMRSPAGEEHQYAVKVLEARTRSEQYDPTYFAYIKNLADDADPWDERNWHSVNPALGKFLSTDTLRDEAREAKGKPSEENDFRRFRLGQWVRQVERRIPLHIWDAAGAKDLMVDIEAWAKKRQCWGGVDLAATQDVNALVWDFPDPTAAIGNRQLYRFWIPEERLLDFDKRTNGEASVWVKNGYLKITRGNVTDYDAIEAQIVADGKDFDIQELGYDPWNAGDLVNRLEDAPFETVEVRQTFEQVAPTTKEWERLIFQEAIRHGGHPVMRWMVDNVVADTDANGNWRISKKKSTEKVDGPVASVMALKLAIAGRTRKRRKRAAAF